MRALQRQAQEPADDHDGDEGNVHGPWDASSGIGVAVDDDRDDAADHGAERLHVHEHRGVGPLFILFRVRGRDVAGRDENAAGTDADDGP